MAGWDNQLDHSMAVSWCRRCFGNLIMTVVWGHLRILNNQFALAQNCTVKDTMLITMLDNPL